LAFVFTDIKNIKKTIKPWGYEKWIASGDGFAYALKEIFFKASFRSSLQFHKQKHETIFFQSGKGIFHYSSKTIDIEKFEKEEYSKSHLQKIINNLQKRELTPGTIIHISPGCIHRIESIENLKIVEASTTQLDDVVRLSDDSGREN